MQATATDAAPTTNIRRSIITQGAYKLVPQMRRLNVRNGSVADWQLAASAVVTGNGKNWVESRRSAMSRIRKAIVNDTEASAFAVPG